MTEVYKVAYAEAEKIISLLPKSQKSKIPNKILEFLASNRDENIKIDTITPLVNQDISNEAKAIIANIYRDYLATDYERQRIVKKQEADIAEEYNIEKVFNKRKAEKTENVVNTEMIEYKESFVTKIMKKVRSLFGS